MEKELYFVFNDTDAYCLQDAEIYNNFEEAKQRAIELAEDNAGYGYVIFKGSFLGTAFVPTKAKFFAED